VTLKQNLVKNEICGGQAVTTNNQMELTAAVEALKLLDDQSAVIIYTDSQYVKNGIGSWIQGWKKNGWKTAAKKPVKNQDLWKALDAENSRLNVEWRWVKGHAGDYGNERADQLANQGIELIN